jgi:hypothetical protein
MNIEGEIGCSLTELYVAELQIVGRDDASLDFATLQH